MVRVVMFASQVGNMPVFIDDTDSGYNGRDAMTRPDVYDIIVGEELELPLGELKGKIGSYATACMPLMLYQNPGYVGKREILDCTQTVAQLLAVPETAAKVLIGRMPEDEAQFAQTALSVIHFYETITLESKVMLPEDAFMFMTEEAKNSMRSVRQAYVLKAIDNQEVLQVSETDTYSIVLANIEDIHAEVMMSVAPEDILRVIAPYRNLRNNVWTYHAIYHTPYYKVGHQFQSIPSWLNWLNGFAVNDTLEIQPHERKMFDNLYMLVCSDTATYVEEIISGLFFHSAFGQKIRKLLNCHNEELYNKLFTDIQTSCPAGVTLDLTYSDVIATAQSDTSLSSLADLVSNAIRVEPKYFSDLITYGVQTDHIVDVSKLPFKLTLSAAEKETYTSQLLKENFVTRAMFDYLTLLCNAAYIVNWGHTGATRAISFLVNSQEIPSVNVMISAYLNNQTNNTPVPADIDMSPLFGNQKQGDDDAVFTSATSAEDQADELSVAFDYYISDATRKAIEDGDISLDYFATKDITTGMTETAVIEYWRRVNGSANLIYFLSSLFMCTGNIKHVIECFLKLMRWGSIKPSLLVINDCIDMKTVFDLNTGKEIPNTAIVDESKLVLVNGCSMSLVIPVLADDVMGADPAIVGFIAVKDYGVKKYYFVSWADVGEMFAKNSIDIAELKGVTQYAFSDMRNITEFETAGYAFYASAQNIEQGLKENIQPELLSELALLIHPGILRSASYVKSKQLTMVITTKDKQHQRLSKYVAAIRAAYKNYAQELTGNELSTVTIGTVGKFIYEFMNSAAELPEVNSVRVSQAIQSISLGDIKDVYSDAELIGKVSVVSDMTMASKYPKIDFSDAQMEALNKRLRNRIVMLLLETDTEYILCRADVPYSQLKISNRQLSHFDMKIFINRIAKLKNGTPVYIDSGDGGVKKTLRLHRTLEGII